MLQTGSHKQTSLISASVTAPVRSSTCIASAGGLAYTTERELALIPRSPSKSASRSRSWCDSLKPSSDSFGIHPSPPAARTAARSLPTDMPACTATASVCSPGSLLVPDATAPPAPASSSSDGGSRDKTSIKILTVMEKAGGAAACLDSRNSRMSVLSAWFGNSAASVEGPRSGKFVMGCGILRVVRACPSPGPTQSAAENPRQESLSALPLMPAQMRRCQCSPCGPSPHGDTC
eukprot:2810942-Rhodomonas_salina.1